MTLQLERGVQELMKTFACGAGGIAAACGPTRQNRNALRMSELATLGLGPRDGCARNCGNVARPDRTRLTWSWTPARVQHFISRTRILRWWSGAARTANRGVRHHAFRGRGGAFESAGGGRGASPPGTWTTAHGWLTVTAIEAGVFRHQPRVAVRATSRRAIF